MNKLKILTKDSVSTLLVILLLTPFGFAYMEPNILGAITDEHTVKQTVTAEITFAVAAPDVTMSPSIGGVTGGTGDGGTQFRIVSSNGTGFSVTLNTESNSMEGEDTTGTIPALIPTVVNVPNFTFTTAPTNSAAFAYTIKATTTTDVATLFRDNGSSCNTGSNSTENRCWLNASTSAITILNRTTQTESSGATSTLYYRVIIAADPAPLIPEDIYTATTTLTATNN